MKKLLILNLLLLSSQIVAQNSAAGQPDPYSNKLVMQDLPYQKLVASNLIPVGQTLSEHEHNQLLLENQDDPTLKTDEEFSSFTLIEQLRELDHYTPLDVVHTATLERFIRVYLKDKREYLQRLLGKSDYYFPFFEQALDAEGLPLELKYLAVVESALNPVAVSSSGAKGIWQFMYGTGLEYNLDIDSYVDERYDFVKSTRAACYYLKRLFRTFGNWDLALAAYNSGPGNVRKAIDRAGGNTNYWEIRQYLPRETSSYVPAFYATLYLFTHANYHHLEPVKGDISFYETDTIQVKSDLSFEMISEYTGIESELLKSLNPQYKKGYIPGFQDKTRTLTLPVHYISKFLRAESDLYNNRPSSNNRRSTSGTLALTMNNSHLVKEGDNLQRIANEHGITLEQLKVWNGLDTNFLIAGQRLVITDKKTLEGPQPPDKDQNMNSNQQAGSNTDNYITYEVQYGDTLFKISRMFGHIPIAELRSENGLHDVNYLKPGTLLRLRKETAGESGKIASKS
jgi:membrane-bound lytic murein transglycosylase D